MQAVHKRNISESERPTSGYEPSTNRRRFSNKIKQHELQRYHVAKRSKKNN